MLYFIYVVPCIAFFKETSVILISMSIFSDMLEHIFLAIEIPSLI